MSTASGPEVPRINKISENGSSIVASHVVPHLKNRQNDFWFALKSLANINNETSPHLMLGYSVVSNNIDHPIYLFTGRGQCTDATIALWYAIDYLFGRDGVYGFPVRGLFSDHVPVHTWMHLGEGDRTNLTHMVVGTYPQLKPSSRGILIDNLGNEGKHYPNLTNPPISVSIDSYSFYYDLKELHQNPAKANYSRVNRAKLALLEALGI